MFEQSTTEKKESLESELAKVTKDRDLSMKKKDELTGILSQAAQALRSSLVVITVTDYGFGLYLSRSHCYFSTLTATHFLLDYSSYNNFVLNQDIIATSTG